MTLLVGEGGSDAWKVLTNPSRIGFAKGSTELSMSALSALDHALSFGKVERPCHDSYFGPHGGRCCAQTMTLLVGEGGRLQLIWCVRERRLESLDKPLPDRVRERVHGAEHVSFVGLGPPTLDRTEDVVVRRL
jgi:hypothetical protein